MRFETRAIHKGQQPGPSTGLILEEDNNAQNN
jgi:hypothetical protein